ncbi:hypothetical protein KO561_12865 [Radiobacillus kanasensis]|uniref:HK97-gp10 family putative phage morphogenesis protein n=1 Tax=Radiobacillus kanasensis TaxID=2844358 RepID=UPI001E456935|nr:HK97-gp10 family putative phage morphogenesis protein [Radiobacillus kanasensis]UFT98093.1 hypothetical protein KO561_12865 [Radiobacillus kanasensis]
MGADMKISVRNKVDQLGLRGRRMEGQILKSAGSVVAAKVAGNINRSKTKSPTYVHLQDAIKVSATRTNEYGERAVQVGATKDKSYILKFLELGTSKMSPQLPLTQGIEESKDEVAAVIKEGVKRIFSQ